MQGRHSIRHVPPKCSRESAHHSARAELFAKIGDELFARISTVAGVGGAADAGRDIRGFALEFYCDEGNRHFRTSPPEARHQVTAPMHDRGIPATDRHTHGFGSQTVSFIKAKNERVWVNFRWKSISWPVVRRLGTRSHVVDHHLPEARARHLGGALEQAREVVGDLLATGSTSPSTR